MTNTEKFNKLYEKFHKYVNTISQSYYDQDFIYGEDLAQNTWTSIWKYINNIDLDNPKLKSYILTTVINEKSMIDLTQSRQKRIPSNLKFELDSPTFDDSSFKFEISNEDDTDVLMSFDLHSDIEDHLRKIIAKDSSMVPKIEIWRLRIYSEMTFVEIGDVLGVNIKTARKYFINFNNFKVFCV